jgi:hypothetical protein
VTNRTGGGDIFYLWAEEQGERKMLDVGIHESPPQNFRAWDLSRSHSGEYGEHRAAPPAGGKGMTEAVDEFCFTFLARR